MVSSFQSPGQATVEIENANPWKSSGVVLVGFGFFRLFGVFFVVFCFVVVVVLF